ncbi:TRAFs-binding domain-containing protein [Methylobacter luteus]|uniref:TRAFs-binding domain-containing protein n=1 Tax=Methylobacter luteus TaxID=415 RepID=UPI0003FEDA87|nr:TRAFs-binding domain-containing protein [Methylobacter luteus]
MAKSKKICFVIMGFGNKTDPSTGKTLDLNKTYKNIIQPAVERSGYQCVRADEIQDSGLIDKSMYALLMHADLVVADISTYNPNAIYELGIRHGVRPFTTIILKEKEGKIPFDLDHTRIFHYSHLGEDIGADEAKRCQGELAELIKKTERNLFIDSPLYDFIKDITPPKIPPAEYKKIIDELAERETHIFAIVEKAKNLMDEGNFLEACKHWKKASEKISSEPYFIQQHALAKYKSKKPTELSSLSDALAIIENLDPDGDINDPETLGITGAIYKRLWLVSNDPEYLRRACKFYEKGFNIRTDYYTGENYALCLNMLGNFEEDKEEKTFNKIAARKVRMRIIKSLEEISSQEEVDGSYKWAYATLANCHYGLGNDVLGRKFEKIFMELTSVEWEKETFLTNKQHLMELIRNDYG